MVNFQPIMEKIIKIINTDLPYFNEDIFSRDQIKIFNGNGRFKN